MSSLQINNQSVTLMESRALAAHNMRDLEVGCGVIHQVEVHRGMTVQTSEGHAAGHVAAVVMDQDQQKVTHVLLLQERQLLKYRMIPVELIKQVGDEKVLLRISQPAVDSLPAWHSS